MSFAKSYQETDGVRFLAFCDVCKASEWLQGSGTLTEFVRAHPGWEFRFDRGRVEKSSSERFSFLTLGRATCPHCLKRRRNESVFAAKCRVFGSYERTTYRFRVPNSWSDDRIRAYIEGENGFDWHGEYVGCEGRPGRRIYAGVTLERGRGRHGRLAYVEATSYLDV